MQYQIVSVAGFTCKKTMEKLVEEVNHAIAIGWEPIGGVTIIGTHYAQAMIKRR